MANYPSTTSSAYTGDITLTSGASGKVGIGSTNPQTQLYIAQASDHARLRMDTYSTTDTNSPVLSMLKSGVGTLGSLSATTTGERLGLLEFFGVNSGSSAWALGSYIRVEQDGNAGASYVPARIKFMVSNGSAAPTEAITIDKNGSVGVGTTSPACRLNVSGSALVEYSGAYSDSLVVHGDGSTTCGVKIDVQNATDSGSYALKCETSGDVDSLIVNYAGRVGIGTTAPAAKAHINQSDSSGAIPTLTLEQADTSDGFIDFIGSNRGAILGSTLATASVRVELNGTVYRLALYADA